MMITVPVSVEDVFVGKVIEATYFKTAACDQCRGTGAENPKFIKPCERCGSNGFAVADGMNMYGQKILVENTCTICQGSGKVATKACPSCSGKKVKSVIEKVKIKIPKGLPDGNTITIKNFGDETPTGAPSDL